MMRAGTAGRSEPQRAQPQAHCRTESIIGLGSAQWAVNDTGVTVTGWHGVTVPHEADSDSLVTRSHCQPAEPEHSVTVRGPVHAKRFNRCDSRTGTGPALDCARHALRDILRNASSTQSVLVGRIRARTTTQLSLS